MVGSRNRSLQPAQLQLVPAHSPAAQAHLSGLSGGKENSAFMVRSIMRDSRRMGSSCASLGMLRNEGSAGRAHST